MYVPGFGNSVGELSVKCGFGLCVRVRGAEAFVGGTEPVPELLATAARAAVNAAQELSRTTTQVNDQRFALASVPVAKGEWRAPIAIDPFALSVDDHAAIMGGCDGAHDGRLSRWSRRGFQFGPGDWWRWLAETRVFASSEGSLVTQFLGGLDARMAVRKWDWRRQRGEDLELDVASQHSCTGGVELLLRPEFFAELETTMEELARYAALPCATMDVGRYAAVLDGPTQARLLGQTVLPALSLRRVLGHEIDVAGTSFFAPPDVAIGDRVCSPLLSCAVDGPGQKFGMIPFGARQWDDEGVATRPVSLIERGTLVNYLASRATLPALGTLSKAGTVSATLGGITQATFAARPAERPPSVSMAPSSSVMSLDGLARQIGVGVLVRGGYVSVDPEGHGGYVMPGMACEVRGGRVVRRIRGSRLMFSTKRLLQTLSAIGDANTLGTVMNWEVVPGIPWSFPRQALTAPAACYREFDLVPRFLAS